ncbi:hypothetical protein [Methylobacterium terricola]|uniref:hypothetical protein n=1 Tax=Methylobacterium terricola TaxID=2583531 RepID=UPI00197B5630|nr:hypothetical protein [Methylobacterium terricola]
MSAGRHPAGWRAVFGVPLLVGLATLTGLLAALLHEGAGWVVSWLALSLPLALIGWHVAKASRGRAYGILADRGRTPASRSRVPRRT